MTVHEVSQLSGVSIRTLHYYDTIGLLHPTSTTDAGYRQYDEAALEQLQQILLFRELEFPLKEIKNIMKSADYDRSIAVEQQIALLTMKKEHLEKLIEFARGVKTNGAKNMSFEAFDTKKMDEYARQAKKQWGSTSAYKEYETSHKARSIQEEKSIGQGMMQLFTEFGTMMDRRADVETVQVQVRKLQEYITVHYYTCTDEILKNLGMMYIADTEFMKNIDLSGGDGCASFVAAAIEIYCG